MNRCPSCGTSYPDDARFCTRDGTRLVTSGTGVAGNGAVAVGDRPPRPIRQETTPAPVRSDLVGKTLDGRYEIKKKIGEGGMSFVYLATDIWTDEPCAIKVLSA